MILYILRRFSSYKEDILDFSKGGINNNKVGKELDFLVEKIKLNGMKDLVFDLDKNLLFYKELIDRGAFLERGLDKKPIINQLNRIPS